MLRVRTLLEMSELRLVLRAGDDLLDRPVTRIYGTELPNPRRYLSGGELVLSGLLWRDGPEDTEPFVAALADAGVAALAASETDARTIPEDLIEACRRHRVPLLEVPVDLSFATITERVVSEMAAERIGDAGSVLGRHRRLLSVVAEGGGLQALLAAGAVELGARCWVLSTTGRVVAGVGDDPPVEQRAGLVREFLVADRLPRQVRRAGSTRMTLLPVTERAGGRLTSWFLVVADEGEQQDAGLDEVAAELASLIGLERSRVSQSRQIENRAAGPLFRLVLSGAGGPVEISSRIAASGLDVDEPLRVLAASASDQRPAFTSAVLEELLAHVAPQSLVSIVGEEVYALVPAGRHWSPTSADDVRTALRTLEPGLGSTRVLLGISSPAPAAGLRGAVEEASHARRLGERRPGRTCVVAGEEIALHQLLLATLPEELRRSLRRRLLGPVLDYDAEHGSDLVGTLRVFLACSGSWTAAAAKLHVHVNTLRYRVRRVEELLEVDLASFPERVDLYLALESGA
ncbi:PucR family transcriptional regulator [Solihabitans fulvus]|uniref:PucR family transcriptional regulator n=1 Tax=Solihabitans fulvus TaxID=1892852 RepID=A0A5B2WYU8_9PSEU|nr:PucR family transcriptional regulator [Solihabitans fulvus]KAA2256084.1 PucR family transcriptional regulator [Solihabitans fulvus]